MVRILGPTGKTVPAIYTNLMSSLYPDARYEVWKYSCDSHGLFEAVVDANAPSVSCPRCEEEARQRKVLGRQREIREKRLMEVYGIPRDAISSRLDEFEVRKNEGAEVEVADKAAIGAVREMVDFSAGYGNRIHVRTLVICGRTGVGKTYLGSAAVIDLAERNMSSCLYISDSNLRSRGDAAWKSAAMADLRTRLESVELLVVDDVDPALWAGMGFFADLFLRRYDAVKRTVILTNRRSTELFSAFGDAVASRMKRGRIVNMIGSDRRASGTSYGQGELGF